MYWGRIGNALGMHWGRIGDTLGTHWGYIGDALETHWIRMEIIGDAWGRFEYALEIPLRCIWDA